MITIERDGVLKITTDRGIAVFFYGNGVHSVLIEEVAGANLDKEIENTIHFSKITGGIHMEAYKPVAMWVVQDQKLDKALVYAMDQDFYSLLIEQTRRGMNNSDFINLTAELNLIIKWIPDFLCAAETKK